MKLTRRNFLAWASLSAVGAVSCDIFREGEMELQSPALLPEDLVKGTDNWFATLCRQCPASEGIIVRVMEGRAKKIRGNPGYPVNWGKQSVRCDGGLQALYHPDRVSGPRWRPSNVARGDLANYQPVTWAEALDLLKRELTARGDGLMLATEPLRGHLGMIAGRFASSLGGRQLGFEALDQTTYRAAVKAVFGQDLLPDFDIAHANRIISFGADFLSTWISPTRWSVGYGEFRQGAGRQRRGQLIQVEPRFSLTAANADKWLPIKPGTEGYLALSIASVILEDGLAPSNVINQLTGNNPAALNAFRPDVVGPLLELPQGLLGGQSDSDLIHDLAHDLAEHGPSLALGGDSAAAHSNGLFNLQAIYALNYLLGSVGQPGGVRFNPGSPLPNLPATAQTGSLRDWVELADNLRNGNTRLLLLHQADLVHGLPASVGLRDALQSNGLFIASFSPFVDETSALADLILPDRIYLEDWGDDIPEPGPGYQMLGLQQPVVNPVDDLDPRSFGDVLLTLAQELGHEDQLPWNSLRDALRQSVTELYNLNRGTSTEANSADDLWNLMLRQGGWWDPRDTGPGAVTPPSGLLGRIAGMAQPPRFSEGGEMYLLPFAHNSLLDGRNAHIPWDQAAPDPLTSVTWQTWVEINEGTARGLGLREGDVAEIRSSQGSIRAVVYPTPALPPNVVGIPLGQGHQAHGSAYATGGLAGENANVLDLLSVSQVTESGGLAWAANKVSVSGTGESLKISKFEGDFSAREIANTGDPAAGEPIIKTVTGEEDAY